MNRNCIVRADRLLIPDRLVDLVDGEDFSGVFNEQKQDIVLDRCQLDEFAVHGYFLIFIVDLQAAAFEYVVAHLIVHISQLRVAAELRFHAGDQFQRVEWLRDIIIRTDISAQNLVRILRLRGKDNDRDTAGFTHLQRRPDPV